MNNVKVYLSTGVSFVGWGLHTHTDLRQILSFLYKQLKDGQRLWQAQSNVLKERDKREEVTYLCRYFSYFTLTLICHLELHELLQRLVPHEKNQTSGYSSTEKHAVRVRVPHCRQKNKHHRVHNVIYRMNKNVFGPHLHCIFCNPWCLGSSLTWHIFWRKMRIMGIQQF